MGAIQFSQDNLKILQICAPFLFSVLHYCSLTYSRMRAWLLLCSTLETSSTLIIYRTLIDSVKVCRVENSYKLRKVSCFEFREALSAIPGLKGRMNKNDESANGGARSLTCLFSSPFKTLTLKIDSPSVLGGL